MNKAKIVHRRSNPDRQTWINLETQRKKKKGKGYCWPTEREDMEQVRLRLVEQVKNS